MEILFGSDLAPRLIKLVENAQKEIVLISPYFRPWGLLTTSIQNVALVKKVPTILILRGGDDRAEQSRNAAAFEACGVKVGYLDRLHAKIYYSEQEALITSLNMLESSANGSWEVAIHLTRAKDPAAFGEVVGVVKRILELTKNERERLKALGAVGAPVATAPVKVAEATRSVTEQAKAAASKRPASAPARAQKSTLVGHCIRCGEDIPHKPEKPLCKDCYPAWAKFENVDYEEKFCHSCGKKRATSMRKPECKDCYFS